MSLALLDCPTGLAGDMLLAALLDLEVPEDVVHGPLAALGLAGRYRIERREERSGGLRGVRLRVQALESEPHHRPWGELRRRLAEAPLEPALRQRVLMVFGLLAEAEAAVHGHAPEQVHFHEVGAIDALVDIVGVCAGLLHLGVERLICGVPPAGHGSVATAHGLLPLPAPAVLEIARRRSLPLGAAEGFPPGELTTPTGLALMACWAERFGPAPAHRPRAVGVGLGTRELDRPNLLRIVLADPLPDLAVAGSGAAADGPGGGPGERREPLLLQQAQIDDASAEDLAFLAEELRRAGALEVFAQTVAMKKGRQGTLLSALLPPERAAELRRIWWRHGTSLGVRELPHWRWILPREGLRLDTPLGPVRLKRALLPDGRERLKPEHDDLAGLARQHNRSLQQVREVEDQALAEAESLPAGEVQR